MMANMQQSLSLNPAFGGVPAPPPQPLAGVSTVAAAQQAAKDRKMASAEQLVLELGNADLRENALLELSKVGFSHFVLLDGYHLWKRKISSLHGLLACNTILTLFQGNWLF